MKDIRIFVGRCIAYLGFRIIGLDGFSAWLWTDFGEA